jgi:hypothetical protein
MKRGATQEAPAGGNNNEIRTAPLLLLAESRRVVAERIAWQFNMKSRPRVGPLLRTQVGFGTGRFG